MNVFGFMSAILAVFVFAFTYRHLKATPLATRCSYFVGFFLLSGPALLFTIHYAHILPEWEWFYSLRACRGSEFLILFLAVSSAAASSLLPRLLRIFPLLGLFTFASVPYIKPLVAPLKDGEFRDLWKNNICLQSTSATCGPASVCTILKKLGTDVSEKEVARAAFTYAGGTEAWYLPRYVRSKGFNARFDFQPSFSPSTSFPAVLGINPGGAGHFIAILDIQNDIVTFADPLHGQEQIPLKTFQARHTFSGFHLVITKS